MPASQVPAFNEALSKARRKGWDMRQHGSTKGQQMSLSLSFFCENSVLFDVSENSEGARFRGDLAEHLRHLLQATSGETPFIIQDLETTANVAHSKDYEKSRF